MIKYPCNHYVPILKSKKAEFQALNQLSKEVIGKITPFIDVHNVKINEEALSIAKDRALEKNRQIKNHFDKVATRIVDYYDKSKSPLFVDLIDIEDEFRTFSNINSTTYLFDKLRNLWPVAIPVLGIERDEEYKSAVKNIVHLDKTEVCIRVKKEIMEVGVDYLNEKLKNLVEYLEVNRNKIHLLLDFRSILNDDPKSILETAENIAKILWSLDEWKTLTIAASGYPPNLSDIKADSDGNIKRIEFDLWRKLVVKKRELTRLPSFSDYGIVHPDLSTNMEWSKVYDKLPAKIRYTNIDGWAVFKGHSYSKIKKQFQNPSERPRFTDYMAKQFQKLSMRLVNTKDYRKKTDSWGDRCIYECAHGRNHVGDLKEWVKIDTNHHITFVAKQVSNTS